MKPLSLMLKPASSECNLNCKYCFYHSLCASRSAPSHGFMSESTLETVLKKAFEYTGGAPLSLSFQGGEPLLRGKDFFRRLSELLSERRGGRVFVDIQTNGTLIDEEWCDIFKSNGWLVGLSLDGDGEANAFRVDKEGKPTFAKVFAAAKLMREKGVDFNILSVLTEPSARRIEEIYDFFRENSFGYLQFIPCLKPFRFDNGVLQTEPDYSPLYADGRQYTLSAEAYSLFLEKCFARYYADFTNGNYVSIRQFDNFVRLARLQSAEQCGMNGYCTRQFVVESDGEVYPCDFYCLDEYSLGNVLSDGFEEMGTSAKALNSIKESTILPEKCKKCKYFALCRNGCKRERQDIDKCEAYRNFFEKNISKLQKIR